MYYPRRVQQEIDKYINKPEIIVLNGMRRSGKTTLYRQIFQEISSSNKVFLDMENPLEQKLFEENDYNNIIANLKDNYQINEKEKIYLFMDEIQAMPSVTKAIKYLYDHWQVKFFLTGSSSYYLKNLFPESLAGRKYVFELFPLDFQEFLIFKNKNISFPKSFKQKTEISEIMYEKTKKLYDEYLRFGGFPGVVLAETVEEKKMALNDIFKSYFEKDVKNLGDFKDLRIFRDLILLLMQRVGAKIDISKLGVELGVSRETIYSYLGFLESTYFVYFLRPFSRSTDREVSGARKVYLCDNGFLSIFSAIDAGALFENSVYLNMRKYGGINYYQKRLGVEIDFVIDKKIACEVKITGNKNDYAKLHSASKSLSITEDYLITKNYLREKRVVNAISL